MQVPSTHKCSHLRRDNLFLNKTIAHWRANSASCPYFPQCALVSEEYFLLANYHYKKLARLGEKCHSKWNTGR